MATPPVMRQPINAPKLPAKAVNADDTAKNTADSRSNFFRPKRSAAHPATSEPIRQPSRAQLLAHPIERAVVSADGEMIRVEHLPGVVSGVSGGAAASEGSSFHAQRTEAERRIVLAALEKHGWQITRTAEALDLADHASLLKIMRRLGVQRPDSRVGG